MEILQRKPQTLLIRGSIGVSGSEIPGSWETVIIQGAGKESVRLQRRKNTHHISSTANRALGGWDSDITVASESRNFHSVITANSVRLSLMASSFLERASWSMATGLLPLKVCGKCCSWVLNSSSRLHQRLPGCVVKLRKTDTSNFSIKLYFFN